MIERIAQIAAQMPGFSFDPFVLNGVGMVKVSHLNKSKVFGGGILFDPFPMFAIGSHFL